MKGYLSVRQELPELGEYIRGKLVIVNAREKAVDDEVFSELPAEMCAARPAEVGTVVLLKWDWQSVGYYAGPEGHHGSGRVHTCDVTVIDQSIPAIVARKTFHGGSPPLTKVGSGDAYGSRPVGEIVTYLRGLPREKQFQRRPPQGWTILFRSDDPAVWNTESPGAKFAIPIRRAHKDIRYLRLKRMDTGDFLIVPIKANQIAREDQPQQAEGYWWNGTAHDSWGARHMGLVQVPPVLTGQQGKICVSNHDWFAGSGFGHKIRVDDKVYHCWQGKEIAKTAFEVAVSADSLSKEEQRYVLGPNPDEGPPPRGWTVLFRSDDPTDWNTFATGKSFAIPAVLAHSKVRFLRLKRLDTGENLIIPITREQLVGAPRLPRGKGYGWNGTTRLEHGGHHLGIVQAPHMSWDDSICVMNEGFGGFGGSGFGHKTRVDDRQYYCWLGKEIPKTVFEIAVTAEPLTEAEKHSMTMLQVLRKPRERVPPGEPVTGAIAQPERPPRVKGKKTRNLIRLIDQSQDVICGKWVKIRNVLHCNDIHNVPRMQIPYQPPQEYDFVVTFSQPSQRNGICLIMPHPRGGSFCWLLGHGGGWRYGFLGQGDDAFSQVLPANKAITTTVQVRRNGIRALIDGMVMAEVNGYGGLTCDDYRKIPNTNLLAVGCDDPTVFHYIQVTEISGTGRKTR
jgi:hypothetical protein